MYNRRWIIPLAIGIIFLGGLGYWGYQQFTLRKQLEVALTNKYYCSFYDALTNIQNMEVLLSKLLVAQAPEQDSKILMEIWQRANAAQNNLNQLPLSDISIAKTSKFITQTGDYAYSLAKKIAFGQEKQEEEWATLKNLYKQASALNTDLQNIERQIADGKLHLGELARQTRHFLQRKGSPKPVSRNFRAIEERMEGIPGLIYDGPFSDHLERKDPLGITGEKITTDQARKKALDFVDRRFPRENYIVERVSLDKGKIKNYHVDISSRVPKANEKITVALCETGGHVLWYTNSRQVSGEKLSLSQARERAIQFLTQKGYQNLTPTYYEQGAGVCIFNFVPTQNGVLLYPDQIKITVALDNGQILGAEAAAYLMNHHPREIPKPKITAGKARKKLSPHLTNITGGHLALIPVGPDKEKLVYEFRGELDNDTFLIYINAVDGKEEQVLRLVRNTEGVLTL